MTSPLLLPVVAVQGRWVRRRTPLLPPADGPTTGVVEQVGTGSAAPLRLAVVGESTAAGCGVGRHEDGFVGHLARTLAARSGRAVHWGVVGRPGATLTRVRHRLVREVDPQAEVTVLLAGVNDVLTGRTTAAWSVDLDAVLAALPGTVLMTGLPDFRAFPALPRPLSGFLAARAARQDEASQTVCEGHLGARWVGAGEAAAQPGFFASDGFHPSALGYRHWAERVAQHLDR